MGWQSYYIKYQNDTQFQKIIETIKSHNNSTDFDNTGEEIEGVCTAKYIKGSNKCILFGNGGGRGLTFNYFGMRGFDIQEYTPELDKKLEDNTLWIKIDI